MNYHVPLNDKELVVSKIINAISEVTNCSSAQIHEPSFMGNEWKYVKKCLDSTYVSSVGSFVTEFEKRVATYTGAKYAVAMVNGTAALHLALVIAGVSAGDEVLVPSLSFVATANAVLYVNAIPHFVDCSEKNFGIDPNSLREFLQKHTSKKNGFCFNKKTNRYIKALVPMHVFGHPCEIQELQKLANDYNLALIEDAAESLGSFLDGKHMGTFGAMGIISFNGNKTITTGGGGVLITNDSRIAETAKYLSTTAKQKHAYNFFHTELGYNYRMPNLNAALGCAQMEQLPKILKLKRILNSRYKNAFLGIDYFRLLDEESFPESNFWLQTILLKKSYHDLQKPIIEECLKVGYQVRPAWAPLHTLPMFSNSPVVEVKNTNSVAQRIINLPSGAGLA